MTEKGKYRGCEVFMLIAHRIETRPNNKQITYFKKSSGVARFSYNWALSEWKRQYKAETKPNEMSLRRQLNAIKREQFPWMFDVTKCASQEAIRDLGTAFTNFFRDCKKPKTQRRFHYPIFKKQGKTKDAFCAANEAGTFRIEGKKIKLPKIGWIRLTEEVRFTGIPKSVVISREADRWFASILIETDDIQPVEQTKASVGVDLGIKTLATLSDKDVEPVVGPKALRSNLKRLARANRVLARRKKDSKRRAKAKLHLQKVHARIKHIRQDTTHKLTTFLAKTYKTIGIEDLNVKGMMANRRLSRAIADVGMYEFKRQLSYKTQWYGSQLVLIDRWFPSSKTCSCCGCIKEHLDLSERTFKCDDCGFKMDRDLNAAINIERQALITASSAESNARGIEGSGFRHKSEVKPAMLKRELNSELCVA